MTADDIRALGVIGAGHSGTTIVYRMLALHPDATWFSQFSQRALLGPPPVRPAVRGLDSSLRRLWPHHWSKVQERAGWRRIVPTPVEGHDLWKHVFGGDAAGTATRLRSLFIAAGRAAGKGTVIVKPPGKYRSRCAPVISAVFPQSRYLHVTRDGRAVALSVFGKYIRRTPGQRDALLRRGAKHWLAAVRQVQQYEQALPVAALQYEALCSDVWSEVRRALEFAGLDPERFPYGSIPRTLTSTNDRRLGNAAPEELAVLEGLLAEDLRRYGYTL